jgi:hypothetical protein
MTMQPGLPALDAPIQGIQLSIIKPIALAVPPFRFATNPADHYAGSAAPDHTFRPRATK